jgi:hypothetical protein
MWPAHPNLLILMSSTMFGPLYKPYSSLFPQDYAVCKIFRALRVWDTTKNLGLSFLFWIKRIVVSSRRPLVRLSFFCVLTEQTFMCVESNTLYIRRARSGEKNSWEGNSILRHGTQDKTGQDLVQWSSKKGRQKVFVHVIPFLQLEAREWNLHLVLWNSIWKLKLYERKEYK